LFLPDVVVEPVEHVVVERDHVDRKAGGALLTEHAVAPHLPDIPLLSYTVKKRLTIFPSPAGMSPTKLSLDEEFVKWRGMGKSLTFFFSVPVFFIQTKSS
jgi:hypothetical protein